VADNQDNQAPTAAPGETLVLPNEATMASNLVDERREIERRARIMARHCLAGRSVNPIVLHELGPEGHALFFRLLQHGMAIQLQEATAARKKEPPPRRTTGTTSQLLNIARGWSARQVERPGYGHRAFRLGALGAAALTVLVIGLILFVPEHLSVPTMLQTFGGSINGFE